MITAILPCVLLSASVIMLDIESQEVLRCPDLSQGKPAAGKRVAITPESHHGTNVSHTVYLPPDWRPDGPQLPIIFEYTGNYFPKSGSTGKVEDARLGYGLSGGRYIWVVLPYISKDGQENAVTWWGDTQATVAYAKQQVPRIINDFHADPDAVFLCGFSRGAIGVNYIGLHDDEIAQLWTAFVSHDHFDGVKEWRGTKWGSPLETYRAHALKRLRRINGRPYLVCQNGRGYGTQAYLEEALPDISNFTFYNIDTRTMLGRFPNAFAKSAHNDTWLYKPSRYRARVWNWMNDMVAEQRN